MGRRNQMENQIEALGTKLKKLTEEVQKKISTMEATEKKTLQAEKEKEQQHSGEAKPREEEEQQQRGLPKSILRRMQEFPLFNGTDPAPGTWILLMEQYFELNHMDDDNVKMMEVVAFCMTGQALAWFRFFEMRKKSPSSWDEFRNALFKRFEGGHTMIYKFISLQQDGSVLDYCNQFELYGALLPDLPDYLLEAKFLNGLKEEIRFEVQMLHPKDIEDMMERARLVEHMLFVKFNENAEAGSDRRNK